MKKLLHFSILLVALTAFTGCYKREDDFSNPIVGTWYLERAERLDRYGWYTFNAGIEQGIFDFYDNGRAEYEENHDIFVGNWYVSNVNGGYYDDYGNYRNGPHQVMRVSVHDNYTNSSITLDFGNVVFYNNTIVATDYYNGAPERYTFRRY